MADPASYKPYIGLQSVTITPEDTTAYPAFTPSVVHEGSWSYSESDPSTQDYIDELTGQPYYIDVTQFGVAQIQLDAAYIDEVDKYRGHAFRAQVVATTKAGGTITFAQALVTVSGSMQQKNVVGRITARCIGRATFTAPA